MIDLTKQKNETPVLLLSSVTSSRLLWLLWVLVPHRIKESEPNTTATSSPGGSEFAMSSKWWARNTGSFSSFPLLDVFVKLCRKAFIKSSILFRKQNQGSYSHRFLWTSESDLSSNPGLAFTCWCDLGQPSWPLCASFSSSVWWRHLHFAEMAVSMEVGGRGEAWSMQASCLWTF